MAVILADADKLSKQGRHDLSVVLLILLAVSVLCIVMAILTDRNKPWADRFLTLAWAIPVSVIGGVLVCGVVFVWLAG